MIEYAKHIHQSYPGTSIILESHAAVDVHEALPFPVYAPSPNQEEATASLHDKVDLVSTLGGDGTILHAAALFATTHDVPPVLSFSMGTLGFLGEWKFHEYKRAFREVYMSGAGAGIGAPGISAADYTPAAADLTQKSNGGRTPHERTALPTGWSSIRGKSMGSARGARVLLRNRLRVGIYDSAGHKVSASADRLVPADDAVFAMNEVTLHRGAAPHLCMIDVFIGGRFLTSAIADGMIISTPTGSTAYSLSSGGSIVHPLVSSLLITPICPRSLSFRPLVLPANSPVTLRLNERNRAGEIEVSVDGVSREKGLSQGMEVRVWGESIKDGTGNWTGGVPSIVRGTVGGQDVHGEDHWVGGLNGLLKFNYPFGED